MTLPHCNCGHPSRPRPVGCVAPAWLGGGPRDSGLLTGASFTEGCRKQSREHPCVYGSAWVLKDSDSVLRTCDLLNKQSNVLYMPALSPAPVPLDPSEGRKAGAKATGWPSLPKSTRPSFLHSKSDAMFSLLRPAAPSPAETE